MRDLPTNFSPAEIESILKRINNPKLLGKMRSTFVVLSDDDYRKKLFKSRPRQESSGVAASTDETPSNNTSSVSTSSSSSSSGKSSKSGHSGSKSGHSSSRKGKRFADATDQESNPAKAKK